MVKQFIGPGGAAFLITGIQVIILGLIFERDCESLSCVYKVCAFNVNVPESGGFAAGSRKPAKA